MVAQLTENSRIILEKRYLNGNETVEGLWNRVSNGNKEYFRLLSELRFLPNSPTLFNAGLNNGCTLSACFVFDIEDSMFGTGSIVETRSKAIAVAKAGGGVGYYFGKLRPKNSVIKSVHRKACGPVTVLLDCHAISHLITQGGKRQLAQMGVLQAEHQDIYEFIHCKDEDPQGLGSFNISVSWKDALLDGAINGTDEKMSKVWQEQCKSAWSHGCPGVLFYDAINRANCNTHVGMINATNPCGETPNRTNEPCNLGSISLPRYFNSYNRDIDWFGLERDISIATEFLDDILDRNEFPHPDIAEGALMTRKLGLGVMGWADLLALMHIHYDTEEALELATKIMQTVQYKSHERSIWMAHVKGPYKGYSETKTTAVCRRNETTTSIAPTGTISMIAGVWGSIEPHFSLRCERTTNEGIKLVDGIQDWVWNQLDGFVPKVASEISPEWHVRHQAAFQKHTDLGVSKTVNLPHNATVDDVRKTYELMYRLGCKGGTVYRDGCRDEQVLVKSKTKSVYLMNGHSDNKLPADTTHSKTEVAQSQKPLNMEASQGIALPAPVIQGAPPLTNFKRRVLPAERKSKTVKFKIGQTNVFLTVGLYPDGSVGEIFVNGSFGTTMAGLLNAFCITFSVALQYGVPLEELVYHHQNTRFEPSGQTDNKDVPMCTSIPDLIVRWLHVKFVSDSQLEKIESGVFCPECGTQALYQAGCLMCPAVGCGWTRCG